MAEIVKIKKDGVIQYPITKPECVIDENGKNVLQLIREGSSSYDDTEVKNELLRLEEEKADKSELTELSEKVENLPTPDWNASEGEKGFIKNRTHYHDFIVKANVDITNTRAGEVINLGFYVNSNTKVRNTITGEIGSVPVDEEFYLPTQGPSVRAKIINTTASQLHILSSPFGVPNELEFGQEIIQPLDDKFISDSIARTSEIPTKLSQLEKDIEIGGADNPTISSGSGEDSAIMKGCEASGKSASAFGIETTAIGVAAHVEGVGSMDPDTTRKDRQCGLAEGYASHSEGTSAANGDYSHAEGFQTHATGNNSHAEGNSTDASGVNSHSEGRITKARGGCSHAEGQNTIAEGAQSHAEGWSTTAKGNNSHAEGKDNTAVGNNSHVEGLENVAEGAYSHSEGKKTNAKGDGSHTEGVGTIANNANEHAEGKYNKSNANTIHSVGIGAEGARKNAHEITDDGKHYILNIGGYDGTNPETSNDVATELTELSAQVGKVSEDVEDKVQKGSLATINGQSIENGGNIVIEGGSGSGSGGDDTMTRILAGATPFICYKKTDGKIGFWDGYFEDLNHRYQTDIVEILFGGLGATPKTAQFLNGWTNLERIYPFMNGSGCTNLAYAFTNDVKLKDLSMLKYWDVSQVTIANECFRDTAPDILPIEDWDISNMTNMTAMFQRYTGVDVDFSKWTNNKVTSLGSFFRESSIKKADLHNISTENCTFFDGFARGASSLEWLDIRGWSCVSAQATNAMHAMFLSCRQLTTLVGDTFIDEVIAQNIKVLEGYTATSNLSIKESSILLNRASLRALINGLADMSETGATLPIGSANIAKLTNDDIAVATAKGWTLS